MWELIVSGKKLLNYLKSNNASIIRSKWSHIFIKYMWFVTTIPIHSNQDLPIWTLKKIMKDLNLTNLDIIKAKK
jgi:predicted RNA binding protein YcfA (HicA-like mRNA interferase family)